MGTVALTEILFTDILFVLGIMLLAGSVTGALVGRVRLPEITGFVIAGVLIGESGIGLVPRELTATLRFITEMALGLIALTIGSEFALSKLRCMGRTVVVITLMQLLATFLLTLPVMYWAGLELPFALIISAIATASSPAVLVATVQSLRARGPFVDCLYGVVALLDAGAVILFGIVFSIAAGMMGLTAGSGAMAVAWSAISEVLYSILFGCVMGVVIHFAVRNKERANEMILVVFGMMLVTKSVANAFHLSTLLVMMTVGAVMINLTPRHHRVFRALEPVTPLLYALFFVLAGCELQVGLLREPSILFLGAAFVVMRMVGKVGGSYAGGLLSGAPSTIRHHLGWCMIPQAGVSLGLVLMVQASPVAVLMTPEQSERAVLVANIVLLAVFVNQLVGPVLAKRAILRGTSLEE